MIETLFVIMIQRNYLAKVTYSSSYHHSSLLSYQKSSANGIFQQTLQIILFASRLSLRVMEHKHQHHFSPVSLHQLLCRDSDPI